MPHLLILPAVRFVSSIFMPSCSRKRRGPARNFRKGRRMAKPPTPTTYTRAPNSAQPHRRACLQPCNRLCLSILIRVQLAAVGNVRLAPLQNNPLVRNRCARRGCTAQIRLGTLPKRAEIVFSFRSPDRTIYTTAGFIN